MDFLYFLLIGLIAGWLAGQLTKTKTSGLVANLIIGVIGALLGGFLFRLLGLSPSNELGKLIAATVGSVLFIMLLKKIQRWTR